MRIKGRDSLRALSDYFAPFAVKRGFSNRKERGEGAKGAKVIPLRASELQPLIRITRLTTANTAVSVRANRGATSWTRPAFYSGMESYKPTSSSTRATR